MSFRKKLLLLFALTVFLCVAVISASVWSIMRRSFEQANQERLQRLCLLTYADIHAVNPEALTPWKAEMLWQLFVATSNYFNRTLDRDRLHAHDETSLLGRIKAFVSGGSTQEIERFLEGFPRRYLAVHSPEEIASHFGLYRQLSGEPVQTHVAATRHGFALTLLTPDRPALFSTISGVLAGGLYGLLAMGLSLSWGLLRLVNLSHFALAFLAAYLVYELDPGRERVGGFDTGLVHDFMLAFTNELKMNLHIDCVRGRNPHHKIEAAFKGLGRALDAATALDPRVSGVLSTKGAL